MPIRFVVPHDAPRVARRVAGISTASLPTLTPMSPRRRSALPALGLAVGLLGGLLSGCTSSQAADRRPGDPVTEAEAESLALLLQRNYQHAGADFVVTAPHGAQTVLTLTGVVDFRRGEGRAEAVTSFGDERADATATVYFSDDTVWVGTAALPEVLARTGAPDADFLRRPVAEADARTTKLIDVLVHVVLNLAGARADDTQAFLERDWTWAGRRSIDSRLSSVFADPKGRTVAVSAADDLLLQYVAPLPGQDFEVTVTLAAHGPQSVDLPGDDVSAEASDHPRLAARLGL